MKKWLISFLIFSSLFFINISSSKAYISEVHYDYEQMYNNLSQEQITFLNDVISKLNATPYRFMIVVDNYGGGDGSCHMGAISQSDYNTACTPAKAPITYFNLKIFNPAYYDENSYLGFAVSSGFRTDTVAPVGLITGTYLNKNTGSFLQSNLSDVVPNNDLLYSVQINSSNYESVINKFLANPRFNSRFVPYRNMGYSNNYSSGSSFKITYIPYFIYKNFKIPLVNVVADTGLGRLEYIRNQTYIDYQGESTKYSNTDSDFPFLFNFFESNKNFINVKKMGNNQFGITSNDISYSSAYISPTTISCPNDREFKNNFCYLSGSDFDNDDLNYFDVRLKLGSSGKYNIPIDDEKYYILTIRYDNMYNLSPNNISYFDSIGQTLHTSKVEEYNVVDNGLYKDLQIVFKVDVSTENTYFEYLDINFDNLSDYDINKNSFNYGVYNVYKLSKFGSTLPTFTDLSNDYDKNTINSIENGSSSNDNFFTNFKLNNYGLGTIITAPIRIYNSMSEENVCSPLIIPFPNSNKSITIPCIRGVIEEKLGLLFTILQTIISGLICYRVSVNWLSTIKNLQNPKNDSIEVVDL